MLHSVPECYFHIDETKNCDYRFQSIKLTNQSTNIEYYRLIDYIFDDRFLSIMHLSMLCLRGGPRDRVRTLIRNKNLESNFLTLGIRFQFKVPHLGEGFEFNISHETENFKSSDHEVKNRCLHLRLSMIMLLQWKAARRSALFTKYLHPNKALKTSFNLISLSWWIHKPQNITTHYIYFRVNMYNQFQLSYCWPSCCSIMWYTLSVVYTKNKNSELLLLINLASQKGKRIAWICNYM